MKSSVGAIAELCAFFAVTACAPCIKACKLENHFILPVAVNFIDDSFGKNIKKLFISYTKLYIDCIFCSDFTITLTIPLLMYINIVSAVFGNIFRV